MDTHNRVYVCQSNAILISQCCIYYLKNPVLFLYIINAHYNNIKLSNYENTSELDIIYLHTVEKARKFWLFENLVEQK